VLGVKIKKGLVRISVILKDRPTFSHINGKLSHRDLSNNMAVQILKSDSNTHSSRFSFTSETGKNFLTQVFHFFIEYSLYISESYDQLIFNFLA